MDFLNKIFPISFKCGEKDAFIKALILYIVAGLVGGIIIGLLSRIPFIGVLFGLTGYLAEVYVTAGIVLSILVFTKVIK